MQRMMSLWRGVGVLAALVALAGAVPVYAQTGGMERRDERRDDRGTGRDAKQACKAGDEKTRAECRQEKRDTKHGGDEGTASEPPAAQPPTRGAATRGAAARGRRRHNGPRGGGGPTGTFGPRSDTDKLASCTGFSCSPVDGTARLSERPPQHPRNRQLRIR